MYIIDLIINIEILKPLVLNMNDYEFNHGYIYIVNFILFFAILI